MHQRDSQKLVNSNTNITETTVTFKMFFLKIYHLKLIYIKLYMYSVRHTLANILFTFKRYMLVIKQTTIHTRACIYSDIFNLVCFYTSVRQYIFFKTSKIKLCQDGLKYSNTELETSGGIRLNIAQHTNTGDICKIDNENTHDLLLFS